MTLLRIWLEITYAILESGQPASAWYVGISNDVERRLFSEHNVSREHGNWIYCPADSIDTARLIENDLTTKYGCDGGPGGGNDQSTFVYAYLKTPSTIQGGRILGSDLFAELARTYVNPPVMPLLGGIGKLLGQRDPLEEISVNRYLGSPSR